MTNSSGLATLNMVFQAIKLNPIDDTPTMQRGCHRVFTTQAPWKSEESQNYVAEQPKKKDIKLGDNIWVCCHGV